MLRNPWLVSLSLFILVEFPEHLRILVLVQDTDDDGCRKADEESGKQFVDVKEAARQVVPDDDRCAAGDDAGNGTPGGCVAPEEGEQDEGSEC